MQKTISNLESDMRSVLLDLTRSTDYDAFVSNLTDNRAIAMRTCIENHYIENISFWPTSGGRGVFNNHGNIYITEAGLKFLHDTSPAVLAAHAIFRFLGGIKGFLSGVATTVLANYLSTHYHQIYKAIASWLSRLK